MRNVNSEFNIWMYYTLLHKKNVFLVIFILLSPLVVFCFILSNLRVKFRTLLVLLLDRTYLYVYITLWWSIWIKEDSVTFYLQCEASCFLYRVCDKSFQIYRLGKSLMYNNWSKIHFNLTWPNFIITNILGEDYWKKSYHLKNFESRQ